MSDNFVVVTESEIAEINSVHKPTKTHKRVPVPVQMGETEFIPLTIREIEEMELRQFQYEMKHGVRAKSHKWKVRDAPICFVDGEGSNTGEPEHSVKDGLVYSRQRQNYSLLGVTFEGGLYEKLIGENNCEQLSTVQCLDFLVSIPRDYIAIAFGFSYDVEWMLKDVSQHCMAILQKSHWVRWKNYKINWTPGKFFYVEKRLHKKKSGLKNPSRRIYDIAGFFGNVGFAKVTRQWKVATEAEQTFLEKMKSDRPDFGPITEQTLEYNRLEGILGCRVFEKIRTEWTGLGLSIPSPHGAGSLASAMFRKNSVELYMSPRQYIPPSPIKRAYIGGRFDFTRQGRFGTAYEYDINSAYPHQMRFLPCLAHCRIEQTTEYVADKHSLWLVRWSDTDQLWSPFPFRENKRIRYHSSGIGWYYGDEVYWARKLDPSIEILEGYRFIPECSDVPFNWIEEYYYRRKEIQKDFPFTAEVLKIGMNSAYGKLAQTKGLQTPPYQNLIWAGMITSGTRAMLMEAICMNPSQVIACSTDSITSLVPLPLQLDEVKLGSWKEKILPDLLLLGNGFAYSSDKQKDTHRGFPEWNWEEAQEQWERNHYIVSSRNDTFTALDARIEKKEEWRGSWIRRESKLEFNPPHGREWSDGWLYPSTNPSPWMLSDELAVDDKKLRASQFGPPVPISDFRKEEELVRIVSSGKIQRGDIP